MKYAIKSAAWYWNKNNLNQDADKDEIEKVSEAVNHPKWLNQQPFKSDGVSNLDKRKQYYKNGKFHLIFNHKNFVSRI